MTEELLRDLVEPYVSRCPYSRDALLLSFSFGVQAKPTGQASLTGCPASDLAQAVCVICFCNASLNRLQGWHTRPCRTVTIVSWSHVARG